jgi:hypothetical protein
MKEQFYDLNVNTLEDGTIRLEQRDCGESVIIDAHPHQLIYIANDLSFDTHQTQQHCNAAGVTTSLQNRITTLERRLLWMRDRFAECHAALPVDMYERCAEAYEFSAWLTASIDVSTEYCADIGNLPNKPPYSPMEAPELAFEGGSLPSNSKCANGLPEHHNADLFSEVIGRG